MALCHHCELQLQTSKCADHSPPQLCSRFEKECKALKNNLARSGAGNLHLSVGCAKHARQLLTTTERDEADNRTNQILFWLKMLVPYFHRQLARSADDCVC